MFLVVTTVADGQKLTEWSWNFEQHHTFSHSESPSCGMGEACIGKVRPTIPPTFNNIS